MYGGIYKPRKQWRKSYWWHLKQVFSSYKIWKDTKQYQHSDFVLFHCWRIYLIYQKRDTKIYD